MAQPVKATGDERPTLFTSSRGVGEIRFKTPRRVSPNEQHLPVDHLLRQFRLVLMPRPFGLRQIDSSSIVGCTDAKELKFRQTNRAPARNRRPHASRTKSSQ